MAARTCSNAGWKWGFGRVVGAGNHDDADTNAGAELRYAVDVTNSADDDTGGDVKRLLAERGYEVRQVLS